MATRPGKEGCAQQRKRERRHGLAGGRGEIILFQYLREYLGQVPPVAQRK
jgi:hypothetical protein